VGLPIAPEGLMVATEFRPKLAASFLSQRQTSQCDATVHLEEPHSSHIPLFSPPRGQPCGGLFLQPINPTHRCHAAGARLAFEQRRNK
jgi:hypothetical protein